MKISRNQQQNLSDTYPVAFAVELGSVYCECPKHELLAARNKLNQYLGGDDDSDHGTSGKLQLVPDQPSPDDLAAARKLSASEGLSLNS